MGLVRFSNRVRPIFAGAALIGVLGAGAQAAPKAAPGKAPSASARPASPPAAASNTSKTLLDTALVRRLYLDGEFDQAIDKLETSFRYGTGHTHEDSVFAFKHLGVMHAAKYETREKGKRYMHQLLAVEPTARILDMYASDMIYMIFKNIKDEFDAARVKYDRGNDIVAGGAKGDSGAQGSGNPSPPGKKKTGGSGKYLLGAGAVAVAAGAVAWYYFSEEPKTVNRELEVE